MVFGVSGSAHTEKIADRICVCYSNVHDVTVACKTPPRARRLPCTVRGAIQAPAVLDTNMEMCPHKMPPSVLVRSVFLRRYLR